MINRLCRTLGMAASLCCACSSSPSELEQSGPYFDEVSQKLGVDYVQGPLIFGMENLSAGATVADYDGDGWVDLFVTRLGANILYKNIAGDHFEDRTEEAFGGPLPDSNSMGAGWGDIDNDGDPDLFVTVIGGMRHRLYLNDHGTFTEQAMERNVALDTGVTHSGWGVAFGDYDRDGFLDIYAGEYMQSTSDQRSNSRLLHNLGSSNPGYFEDVTDASGVNMDWMRGIPETGCSTTPFADPCQAAFVFSPRFSDLNGDGCTDLVVAGDFGTSRLFLGRGDGTFADSTSDAHLGGEQNAMGSTIGDYDGDGDLDWFISAIYEAKPTGIWGTTGNRLYKNDGQGAFSDATDVAGVREGGWGWGTSWLDYDNDARLDLVMTNGIPLPPFDDDPMRLWHNSGDGSFREVAELEGVTSRALGRALLTFDFDRDGDQDIFVANNAERPVLYRNLRGNSQSWLTVKLVGVSSNRDGIGARVSVQARKQGPSQVQELGGGTNYLSQNENVAHFGLGSHSGRVNSVVVTWPSGITQTVNDVEARQIVTITEESGADDTVRPACRSIH